MPFADGGPRGGFGSASTEDPGDVFFVTAAVDNWGRGFRIYDNEENVYEARHLGEADVRLYTHGDVWETCIRKRFYDTDKPGRVGRIRNRLFGPDPAYTVFRDTADNLETFYGIDLRMDQDEFDHWKKEDNEIAVSDINKTVSVNWEHEIDFPQKYFAKVPYYLMPMGGIYGEGGRAITELSNHPELGAIAFAAAGLFPLAGWAGPKGAEIYVNRRNKKRIQTVDALEDDVFSRINEQNRLEALRDIQEYTNFLGDEKEERHRELRNQKLYDELKTLMGIQFHEFNHLKGVIATTSAETYEDAATFAAVAAGDDPEQVPDKAPSIYQECDVFQELLDEMTVESDVDDTMYLVPAGKTVIRKAVSADTTHEIDMLLEREYSEPLDNVGIDYALEGEE